VTHAPYSGEGCRVWAYRERERWRGDAVMAGVRPAVEWAV
jgi:hypothetical protein